MGEPAGGKVKKLEHLELRQNRSSYRLSKWDSPYAVDDIQSASSKVFDFDKLSSFLLDLSRLAAS